MPEDGRICSVRLKGPEAHLAANTDDDDDNVTTSESRNSEVRIDVHC
jgi:hypothetical protein